MTARRSMNPVCNTFSSDNNSSDLQVKRTFSTNINFIWNNKDTNMKCIIPGGNVKSMYYSFL